MLRHENQVLRRQLSGRLRWDHADRLWLAAFQAHAIVACGFLVVETAPLKRLHVLVFTEHGTRRLHLAGVTAHPTGAWAVQQAGNLADRGNASS